MAALCTCQGRGVSGWLVAKVGFGAVKAVVGGGGVVSRQGLSCGGVQVSSSMRWWWWRGQVGAVKVVVGVVSVCVPFPMDEILKCLLSSRSSFTTYFLHFPFFLPIDYIWARFFEVRSMHLCFMIGCQQCGMENVVDLPLRWQY